MRASVALLLAAAVAGCTAAPAPDPTELPGGACGEDLPERTSSADHPVAILHIAGDDVPPVVSEIDWQGGAEPLETSAPRPVHLQRFTVLQVREATELSVRLTDGVPIAGWTVTAIPDGAFRAGETEDGSEWSQGEVTTSIVCVPVEDGEWAIRGDVTFANDAGRGTFFWRINVSQTPGA